MVGLLGRKQGKTNKQRGRSGYNELLTTYNGAVGITTDHVKLELQNKQSK